MTMRSVQFIFRTAAIYGLFIALFQYFQLGSTGTPFPTVTSHPEYFYGFLGIAAVFQILFLIIAHDPMRYRALIPVCLLEKAVFADTAAILYYHHQLTFPVFIVDAMDLAWAILFAWAFHVTSRVYFGDDREPFSRGASRYSRIDHPVPSRQMEREPARR